MVAAPIVVDLVGAGLAVGLGAVLLVVGNATRPNQLLGLVLIMRGVGGASDAWAATTEDRAVEAAAHAVAAAAFLVYRLGLVAFLLAFPALRFRSLARVPFVPLVVGALLVVAVAFVASDVPLTLQDTSLNPFSILYAATTLVHPVGALLLVRDAARLGPSSLRTSVLMVSASFALMHLHDVVALLAILGARHPERVLDPSGIVAPLGALVLVLTAFLVLLAVVARHAAASRTLRLPGMRFYLMTLLAAICTGVIAGAIADARVASLLGAGWNLALPLTVAYALARYQLLGIELRAKWTLRQGTLASFFLVAFFFVSELASNLLSAQYGPFLGIAAASLLVFAFHPLQRVADRIAEASMPEVQAVETYLGSRRRDIYRAALQSALLDGVVTARERDVLATLADELGLTAREALQAEREVAGVSAGAGGRAASRPIIL